MLGLAAILQATLLPHLSIDGIKPHLLLALVAIWSLLHGVKQGAIWALVGGFLLDLLSSAPFGIATVSLVAVSLMAGMEQVRGIHSSILLPGLVAVASLAHDLVFWAQLRLLGWEMSLTGDLFGGAVLRRLLIGVALNVGLAVLVYPLVRRLSEVPEAEEGAW